MTDEELHAVIEERDRLADRVRELEDLLTEIKRVENDRNARLLDALDEITYQATVMDAIINGHDTESIRRPVRRGGWPP
jgi:hypothetical protein